MKQFQSNIYNSFAIALLSVVLGLSPSPSKAETPIEMMRQGRIDHISLPHLTVNDRSYTLANNVTVRQQGRTVNVANLSKGQTIAFTTGKTVADNRTITEVIINSGR